MLEHLPCNMKVTSKHYAIQWKSTVKEDGMTKKLAGHVI
jgi:hypothetical protein